MERRSSLVSRFAASTTVLAAAVVILAILFFLVMHRDFFEGSINATLRGFSLSMAERIWEDPSLAPRVARQHTIGVVVETPQGRLAFGPDGEPIDPNELKAGSRYWQIDASGPDGRRISFFWDMLAFAHSQLRVLAGLIVLLLVTIGVTYAFQVAQLRPLRWLREGVDAVSTGDFTVRVPVLRQDEIGQVAQAFNQMTRRVEQMMRDRDRLLSDVSHELRSPLARIKVALELLPESDKRDAIARDVRGMESLTAVLLERERVRTETPAVDIVDLVVVTREVVDGFEGRSPAIDFIASSATAEIRGDAALLGVLVQNLVDNAVKFSLPDSGPVQVTLRSSAGAVELVVSDDGCGVPETETERIFEPFVKLDPARGHRTGYGLGLDLSRRIVEAHRGTITLGARRHRGTRVAVRLPSP